MRYFKTPCLLLLPVLLLTGCDSFLSHEPDNRTQLNTGEKIAELLVSAYPEANYMTFCEAMTDNVSLHPGAVSENTNTNPYRWENVEDTEQDSPEFYWNACYSAIAAANHALEAIAQSEDPTIYDAQKGEALVARAYAHFMLVTLFAKTYNDDTSDSDPGIPYVTEPEKVALKKYERRTVEYVYDKIESDLKKGIELIRDDIYTIPKYHFTRSAAHAFAVRFYLHKREYNKVLEHANLVFSDNDFASRLRPWNTTYQGYAFDQLEAAYTRSTEKANLLLCETSSLWARRYNQFRYSTGVTDLSRSQAIAGVVDGDFAYTTYFFSNIDVYFVVKFREHFVREDISADIGLPYTIIPLFTAEEVLLSRAEAYLFLGSNNSCIADLNTFFSTRISDYDPMEHELTITKALNYFSAPNTAQNRFAVLFEVILQVRRAEFLHEGLWWFDILRHDLTITHVDEGGEVLTLEEGDPRRVLQIPSQAISQGGLAPNPR